MTREISYKQIKIFMFLISFAIFLFLNVHPFLQYDDMATLLEVGMPFGKMLHFLFWEDAHLPVYFILLKLWQCVFGTSVFAARCFSYFTVLAGAFGVGYMAEKLYGKKFSVWYAALFLFLPVSFWFARTLRMYSLACFFCSAAFFSAHSALLKKDRRSFILYFVCMFLGAWTHYYASLTCALIALASLKISWKRDRAAFKSFFICNAILFLVVCPQIFIVQRQNLNGFNWISLKHVLNASRAYLEQTYFYYVASERQSVLHYVSVFTMCALFTTGFQFFSDNRDEIQKWPAQTGFFIAFLVWFVTFYLSFVYRPMLVARYLTVALGCLYVFFVFGIISDQRNKIIFMVLIFLEAVFSVAYEKNLSYQSPQMLFYQAIKENVRPEDVIIQKNWHIRLWLYYHFPDYDIRTMDSQADRFLEERMRQIKPEEVVDLLKEKNVYTIQDVFPEAEKKIIFKATDKYLNMGLSLEKIEKYEE